MVIRAPSARDLEELDRLVEAAGAGIGPDNVRFHALYGHESSLIAREVPVYQKGKDGKLLKHLDADGRACVTQIGVRLLPMRRRQWIESYCMIRGKGAQLVRLVLNPPQRRLECVILLMERAGMPIRVVILKARQMGFSTYIEAVAFERVVRGKRQKALVVAHDDETATEVLQMTHTMRDEIPRKGRRWNFRMPHTATYHMAWGAPIHGQFKIASAKKKHPGRGFTASFLHLSEAAFWDDAKKKAKSLLNTLAKIPETCALMESTANGASGYFHGIFNLAWRERHKPIRQRKTAWWGLFFPWYEMPDYYYSRTIGDGNGVPDEIAMEILNTLQVEEEWLLTVSFFKRWSPENSWREVPCMDDAGVMTTKWQRVGCGMTRVSLDQLAWRRFQIRDEHDGDPLRPDTWEDFQEEYPATPEQAFLATGALIFSKRAIQEAMMRTADPIFAGTLIDLQDEPGDNRLDVEISLEDYVEKRRNVEPDEDADED